MGISITILLVVFPDPVGDKLIQQTYHIPLHRVIPVFLDHHTCSCALYIDIHQAGLHTGFSHDGLHLSGNVIQAVVGGGGYVMVCCINYILLPL